MNTTRRHDDVGSMQTRSTGHDEFVLGTFDYHGRLRTLLRGVFRHGFVLAYLLATLFPFVWTLSTSLKTQQDILAYPPRLFPSPWTLQNYVDVLVGGGFARFVFNSVFVATCTVALSVLAALFAGFAVSRYQFPGKNLIMFFMLGGMAIGRFANVIPLYFLATRWGLFDTYFVIVMATSALVIPLLSWLMQGYFGSIPRQLDEAARIDGCNVWQVFWRVLIPAMTPAIVAGSVIAMVTAWNEFILAMTLTRSPRLRVLSVAINFFRSELGVQWGALTAASIVATVPIVVVVLSLQKHFIQGLTSGTLGSS